MIDKIKTGQFQDVVGKLSSKQPDSTKATANNNDEDASLHVDYASLISQATQIPSTDIKAVQRAQELLETGKLESQEIILEAAKNMVIHGI